MQKSCLSQFRNRRCILVPLLSCSLVLYPHSTQKSLCSVMMKAAPELLFSNLTSEEAAWTTHSQGYTSTSFVEMCYRLTCPLIGNKFVIGHMEDQRKGRLMPVKCSTLLAFYVGVTQIRGKHGSSQGNWDSPSVSNTLSAQQRALPILIFSCKISTQYTARSEIFKNTKLSQLYVICLYKNCL